MYKTTFPSAHLSACTILPKKHSLGNKKILSFRTLFAQPVPPCENPEDVLC